MKRVLIVDDDCAVTNYLMVFLAQTELYETTVINDSREFDSVFESEPFDVVLLDMDMPFKTGMDILQYISSRGSPTPVVVLTGVADVDLAVRAMKTGAFDYLSKPVEEEHLLEVLKSAIDHRSTQDSIRSMPQNPERDELINVEAFAEFPSAHPEMIRLLHKAEKIAKSDLPVFIWGEQGTGKRLLAEAIHRISSRSTGPFIAVNAAELDEEEFAADFFGMARDYSGASEARTGFIEEANSGTLFIDGVSWLSRPVQVRLKRVIRTGEYYRERSTTILQSNVRIIVAANEEMSGVELENGFTGDLLYHLKVNSLRIPPLRERPCDVPLLAELFLKKEIAGLGKPVSGFSSEFMDVLKTYDYPYNREELKTIISTSVVSSDGGLLMPRDMPGYVLEKSLERKPPDPDFVPRKLSEIKLEHAMRTLEYFGDDIDKTAEELGITIDELERILKNSNDD